MSGNGSGLLTEDFQKLYTTRTKKNKRIFRLYFTPSNIEQFSEHLKPTYPYITYYIFKIWSIRYFFRAEIDGDIYI